MKTVTYRGPDDPRDPTTRYVTADGMHRLPNGVPVHNVPNDVADELAETEGHSFEIAESERQVTAKARDLAEEEGVDLDSIPGDGQIGIDDVRKVIDERENSTSTTD